MAAAETGVIFSSAIEGENSELSRNTAATSAYRVTTQ